MSQAPPPHPPTYPPHRLSPPDPRQKVAEHIRLLGILTWVYAGLELLGVLFGLIYAGVGAYLVANPPAELVQHSLADPSAMPPTMPGWILIGAGAFVLVFTGTLTLLTVMSARDLLRHRRRVFCMVVAGIHCINFPLGMALGIFTIMILCKPEAKELFEQGKTEE